MLTVVDDAAVAAGPAPAASTASALDEIVREAARSMLAAALRAEAAAYVEEHADQVDEAGRRLVVRNGYAQPRQVLTAAGPGGRRRAAGERQAGR
jgi:hypothetical protein